MAAKDKQIGGSHYKLMGIEPWDVVDTWPVEQRIGYYRGGALKYVMRMGNKDEALTEIGKGKHYLEKLMEVLDASNRDQGSSTVSNSPEAVIRTATRTVRKRKVKRTRSS